MLMTMLLITIAIGIKQRSAILVLSSVIYLLSYCM